VWLIFSLFVYDELWDWKKKRENKFVDRNKFRNEEKNEQDKNKNESKCQDKKKNEDRDEKKNKNWDENEDEDRDEDRDEKNQKLVKQSVYEWIEKWCWFDQIIVFEERAQKISSRIEYRWWWHDLIFNSRREKKWSIWRIWIIFFRINESLNAISEIDRWWRFVSFINKKMFT
jgi:hypothetical protein